MIFLKVYDRIISLLKGIFFFLSDIWKYKSLVKSDRFKITVADLYPCVRDKTIQTDFDRHYVYHIAWAIRKVMDIKPIKHVDLSSSLFFSSTLSASIPTAFYDYRPANLQLTNLSSDFADLCSLPFKNESIESLSCMHVVEHVGLGRYGDPIKPDGDLEAMQELKRVVAKGGHLLLVLPVGKERLQFNAHRIYSSTTIKKIFSDWTLEEFYLIPDKNFSNSPLLNASDAVVEQQCYGCGCFLLRKPA